MSEQLFCQKCRKTMADTNFYMYKDGTKAELCKSCLTMHINNFEPDTFLWLLEKFDVPYIEAEWNVLRDRAFAKDPYKMNGMSVFGKYLSNEDWKLYTIYRYYIKDATSTTDLSGEIFKENVDDEIGYSIIPEFGNPNNFTGVPNLGHDTYLYETVKVTLGGGQTLTKTGRGNVTSGQIIIE